MHLHGATADRTMQMVLLSIALWVLFQGSPVQCSAPLPAQEMVWSKSIGWLHCFLSQNLRNSEGSDLSVSGILYCSLKNIGRELE